MLIEALDYLKWIAIFYKMKFHFCHISFFSDNRKLFASNVYDPWTAMFDVQTATFQSVPSNASQHRKSTKKDDSTKNLSTQSTRNVRKSMSSATVWNGTKSLNVGCCLKSASKRQKELKNVDPLLPLKFLHFLFRSDNHLNLHFDLDKRCQVDWLICQYHYTICSVYKLKIFSSPTRATFLKVFTSVFLFDYPFVFIFILI